MVLTACAGFHNLPEEDSPDAQLYKEKCTACHSWAHPARHTMKEWNHYLDLMEKHMQASGIPFTRADRQSIEGYLARHARSEE